jgi:hypothetical protein
MEGVVITSRLLKLSALGEYIEWVDAQQKKICFFFDGKKTGEHTKKEWHWCSWPAMYRSKNDARRLFCINKIRNNNKLFLLVHTIIVKANQFSWQQLMEQLMEPWSVQYLCECDKARTELIFFHKYVEHVFR